MKIPKRQSYKNCVCFFFPLCFVVNEVHSSLPYILLTNSKMCWILHSIKYHTREREKKTRHHFIQCTERFVRLNWQKLCKKKMSRKNYDNGLSFPLSLIFLFSNAINFRCNNGLHAVWILNTLQDIIYVRWTSVFSLLYFFSHLNSFNFFPHENN